MASRSCTQRVGAKIYEKISQWLIIMPKVKNSRIVPGLRQGQALRGSDKREYFISLLVGISFRETPFMKKSQIYPLTSER